MRNLNSSIIILSFQLLFQFVFLFLLHHSIFAQNYITENSAEIATYWKENQSFIFSKKQQQTQLVNGIKISESICNSYFKIDVLSEVEGKYQLSYFPYQSQCSASSNELLKRTYELTDSIGLFYETENTGAWIGMIQKDSIFQLLENKLEKRNMFFDTAYQHKLFLKTDSFLQANHHPLVLKKSLLHDLHLLHLPFGAAYTIGEHYFEPDTFYFSPLQSWITQLMDFELTHINFEAMNCTLQINLTLEKTNFESLFKNQNPKKSISQIPFDKIEIQWDYVLDLLEGKVQYLKYQKTEYFDIIEKIETKIYNLEEALEEKK